MKNLLAVIMCGFLACPAFAFEREDYEEPAGASFAALLNPQDGIYGISMGDGTWLKGTPVLGEFFLAIFSNDIEDSFYSGAGMTFRIMPHWRVAPFVGGGGSYNYSFSQGSGDDDGQAAPKDAGLPNRGDSYWGWHAEAGFRIWNLEKLGLFEIMFRYTWSSLEGGDRDYWLVGISTGPGI